MLIGIISDTHNHEVRTQSAVDTLRNEGVDALVHCGDLFSPAIVEICAVIQPFYFVFGNHDADMTAELSKAADAHGATCLNWGGEFTVDDKRIAVAHGHLSMDLRPLLAAEPDYLLSGHSHSPHDFKEGSTRRINPGALFRASEFSFAILDTMADDLRFVNID